MARNKREFGTIRKMPSGRFQALYTNNAGKRVMAPGTFQFRVDAEGWLTDRRREIESAKHNPSAVKLTEDHLQRLLGHLAQESSRERQTDQTPHARALPEPPR